MGSICTAVRSWFAMRQFVSVVVGLVIAVSVATSADARHRRHRGHDDHAASANDADFRRAAQSYANARTGLAGINSTRLARRTA